MAPRPEMEGRLTEPKNPHSHTVTSLPSLCRADGAAAMRSPEITAALSTASLIQQDAPPLPQPQSHWDLPELQDTGLTWAELDNRGKFCRVLLSGAKLLLLVGLLYMFLSFSTCGRY
ncbi:hypothetical protein JZ751_022317 [Albula glossodonta]|uniref:Uncharacterized protein n=1 Tax=Albula glossodonta TaxID=121402 RepID=A0A8T2MSU5_9TELE|nr:hypothetical protein JZ751_026095 [Albula glossodonta]KAG9330723.1 hypothetical protein JZ751_022317 [Albula glossodonta]